MIVEKNKAEKNEDKKIPLTFAVNEHGKVVSIKNVANGLGCGCKCPVCHEAVMARQGSLREWHFAHTSGVECGNALETDLHLAAKQILAETGWMLVPEMVSTIEVEVSDNIAACGTSTRPSGRLDFQKTEVERALGKVRPDVLAFIDGVPLCIEVAVTHLVDDEKKTILWNAGIPTIEILLSPSEIDLWDWESLHDAVINNIENKQWIVNMRELDLQRDACEQAVRDMKKKAFEMAQEQSSEKIACYMYLGSEVVLEKRYSKEIGTHLAVRLCDYNSFAFNKLCQMQRNLGGPRSDDSSILFPLWKKDFLISYFRMDYLSKTA